MLTPDVIGERLQKQRCKVCWNADGFDFHVPDDVWRAVVPEVLHERVVCLACFDEMARERGVDYAPHIWAEVYFAGRAASFSFRIESASGLTGRLDSHAFADTRYTALPSSACPSAQRTSPSAS